MAYNQHHDPYYTNNVVPDLPPQPAPYNTAYHQQQDYDAQSNWDARSAKSYQSSYGGSQVHLNPQYDMRQVNVPPVPAMPYQPNYPPPMQQRYGPGPYGGAPGAGYLDVREKMMRRRSVRQVELQQGNLVLDMQVPSHLIPKGRENEEEFTKIRYTAATCDPDEFMRNKYSLRPFLMKRQTELFIVMTMYNEDEVLFCRTMNA